MGRGRKIAEAAARAAALVEQAAALLPGAAGGGPVDAYCHMEPDALTLAEVREALAWGARVVQHGTSGRALGFGKLPGYPDGCAVRVVIPAASVPVSTQQAEDRIIALRAELARLEAQRAQMAETAQAVGVEAAA